MGSVNDSLVMAIVLAGIAYGTPLLLAGLGELLSERSGVINVGIEGMMLVGAALGFWASQLVSGPAGEALAFLVAALGGLAMASLHAWLTVTLRVDQIVSGLVLTILGGATGLSTYIASSAGLTGEAAHYQVNGITIPALSRLPVVGPVLFSEDPVVYLSWLIAIVVGIYLYKTRAGRLSLRALGEDPAAAAATGIRVVRDRYVHCMIGGALGGVAGGYYALVLIGSWSNGLTAGAGWVALALVIVAFWRPGLLVVGAYVFGIVTSLGAVLEARGVSLPPEFYSALPYLLTLVCVIVASGLLRGRRWGGPAALGRPYEI